jgi:hypothetical protein
MAILAAVLSLGLLADVGTAARVAASDATLGHGVLGSDTWEVFVHRPKAGPDVRGRPCLGVLVVEPAAEGYEASKIEACGAVVPAPNVIKYSVGAGRQQRTVIAIAFGVQIRKVMVDLGSRGKRRMRPRLLPVAIARKVGLKQFRFVVVPLAGSHCLHRLRGTEIDGTVAIDEKYGDCRQ